MTRYGYLIMCIVFTMLCVAFPAIGEKQVGSVQDISGEVSIDAFGTGDFIEAEVEDPLYEQSVLVTGSESEVEIELNDETIIIPADVEVLIETVLSTQTKKKKIGWLASAFSTIKRILGPKEEEEEEKVLGGRAAEADSTEPIWLLGEEDDNALFQQAQEFIDEGRYTEALERLDGIFFIPDEALPGEVAFLKGHAYYSLGLFDVSIQAFGEALKEIENFGMDIQYIDFHSLLLFELGSSCYMTEKFEEAEAALTRAIEDEDSELAPYALLMLVMNMHDSGKVHDARGMAEQAMNTYRGTPFEAEFAALISAEE